MTVLGAGVQEPSFNSNSSGTFSSSITFNDAASDISTAATFVNETADYYADDVYYQNSTQTLNLTENADFNITLNST